MSAACRLFQSGVIHCVLIVALISQPTVVIAAVSRPSTPPTQPEPKSAEERAYWERKAIYDELKRQADENRRLQEELANTQQLLQLLMQMQARQALPPDSQAKLDEAKAKETEGAAKILETAKEFSTEEGLKFRKDLQARTEQIQKIKISQSTSKKDVDVYLKLVDDAVQHVAAERERWRSEFERRVESLDSEAKKFVESKVTGPLLEKAKLGRDRLEQALKRLDPSLVDKAIRALSDTELARRVAAFANSDGSWSAELIAAFGPQTLGEAFNIPVSPELDALGTTAQILTDVHRAGADFSEFCWMSLETAMATGNPYVVAATVVVLAIIALLRALFGGGGGGGGDGEGNGDGKGKGPAAKEGDRPGQGKGVGSQGRNTGASDPGRGDVPERKETQPGKGESPESAANAGNPNALRLPDHEGPYLRELLKNGTLTITKREGGTVVFQLNVLSIEASLPGKALSLGSPSDIRDVDEIAAPPSSGFALYHNDGRRIPVVQRESDKRWVALVGEELPRQEGGAPGSGKYTITMDGNFLHIWEAGKHLHTVDGGNVWAYNANKQLVKYAEFRTLNIKQYKSFDPANVVLELDYEVKGKTVPARLVRVQDDERWQISGVVPD